MSGRKRTAFPFLAALAIVLPALFPQPLAAQEAGSVTGVPPIVSTGESRFKVEGIGMQALDETGADFWGNDEVVAVFITSKYLVYSDEHGGMSSGDDSLEDFFYGQTCVLPAIDNGRSSNPRIRRWDCDRAGTPGPLSFIVALYEIDEWIFSGYCAQNESYQIGDSDLYVPEASICADGGDNELIGKDDVQLSNDELLKRMPRPGDTYAFDLYLGGDCDGSATTQPCTFPYGGPEYVVTFEVTRIDDQPPILDPNP